jgi:hypothetical protein
MKKLFTLSVIEEDSPAPTEPDFLVNPDNGRRSILLTRDVFVWLALVKKIQKGETVDNPQALASWMLKTGKCDRQLFVALTELFKVEIDRLNSADDPPEVPGDLDPGSVVENFLSLSNRGDPNTLLTPGGPAAYAVASPEVNLDRAFDLVDALRSYLLLRLTSTESVDWQPLADVRLPAAEGDVGPAQ